MKNVEINDIGISIRGRRAISQLRKNKNITRITNDNAIRRFCLTSVNDLRTLFVLSIRVVNIISPPCCDFLIPSNRLLNSFDMFI